MDESLAKKEEEAARNSQLQLAIEHDDVDKLYSLIEEDEKLLDYRSEGPFPNTPLHIAADKGKTKVAMEIAILKPLFARKLNRGGHSPMHLALQKKHYHTVRALMTLDPALIRVRGRGGRTPLHFVAGEKGDNEQDNREFLELLAEFLSACKSSIEDLTSQCETAVHVVVKNGNTKAFKVLFGWLKRVYLTEILNWKDEDGNTVLHIAVLERQHEIIKLLIGYTNVNAKNFQGKTALEIFEENRGGNQDFAKRFSQQARRFAPTLSLPQYFSGEPTKIEKCARLLSIEKEDVRNTILVVTTLIATATYQAALSPPGGFWQDSTSNPQANSTVVTANSSSIANGKPHQAGNVILIGRDMSSFTILNATAFLVSIGTIWATIVPLIFGPALHIALVSVALLFLGITYVFSLTMVFPNPNELAVSWLVVIYMSPLIPTFILPVILWTRHLRVVPRIDAIRRRVGKLP